MTSRPSSKKSKGSSSNSQKQTTSTKSSARTDASTGGASSIISKLNKTNRIGSFINSNNSSLNQSVNSSVLKSTSKSIIPKNRKHQKKINITRNFQTVTDNDEDNNRNDAFEEDGGFVFKRGNSQLQSQQSQQPQQPQFHNSKKSQASQGSLLDDNDGKDDDSIFVPTVTKKLSNLTSKKIKSVPSGVKAGVPKKSKKLEVIRRDDEPVVVKKEEKTVPKRREKAAKSATKTAGSKPSGAMKGKRKIIAVKDEEDEIAIPKSKKQKKDNTTKSKKVIPSKGQELKKRPTKSKSTTKPAKKGSPPSKSTLIDALNIDDEAGLNNDQDQDNNMVFSMGDALEPRSRATRKKRPIEKKEPKAVERGSKPKTTTTIKSKSSTTKTKTKTTPSTVDKSVQNSTYHEADYSDYGLCGITTTVPLNHSPSRKLNTPNTKNGTPSRRSSLGNRGKRLSSVGNGFTAEPHIEIPVSELYKHFDSTLPDPHKMKQLLIWCSKRLLKEYQEDRKGQRGNVSTADSIADVIKDELVRDLVDGKINTSWYSFYGDDDDEEVDSGIDKPIVIKPNPANVANKVTLEQFEKKLNALKKEESTWSEACQLAKPVKVDVANVENKDKIVNEKLGEILNHLAVLENQKALLNKSNLVRVLENIKLTVHKLKESKSLINEVTQSIIGEISSKMKDLAGCDNEGNKIDSISLLETFSKLHKGSS